MVKLRSVAAAIRVHSREAPGDFWLGFIGPAEMGSDGNRTSCAILSGMNRNGFVVPLIIFAVLALALIGGIAYVHYVYLPRIATQSGVAAQSTSTLAATTTQAGTQSSSQLSVAPNPSPSPASAQSLSSGAIQNQGWKMYTNNELGFSFQYPPTYSAIGTSSSPASIGSIFHIQGSTGQPEMDVDFENFAYTNSIEPQNTTIGVNAFNNELVNAADDRYFFDLHGRELLFWFSFPTGRTATSASDTDNFARQILATFSVETSTNPQPSSSQTPAGWKTYSDSQYSLTLNYPGGLTEYQIPYDRGGASPLIFFAHPTGTPPNSGNDEFLDPGSILLTISSPGQSQNPLSCGSETSSASILPTYCAQETVNGNSAIVLVSYLPAFNDPTYQKLIAEKTIIFQTQSLQFQFSSMVDASVDTSALQSAAAIQQSLKSYADQTFDVDRVAATFSFPN